MAAAHPAVPRGARAADGAPRHAAHAHRPRLGLPRQVVIEVVQKDERGYVAASGFGPRADWYRNVMASPDVTLQIGGRRVQATASPIPTEEGGEIMARYAPRHPAAARQLCKLMGFAVDGSAEDYRQVGHHIPFVRFVPRRVP
ncbi:nitroreductase family deazaflavin-dependent oxidoreductase [Actinomadura luteofluorescens]|uniref:nitroreductase family deazaflavin-dependent oxidoreductase n=1 Tax=Actinomadura luteofluorescens TaxID=46163 RepID=UPI003634836D